jgi:hypothetical protein
MAWFVHLTGFDRNTGKPLLKMEPSWWPANEIKNDPRLRETITDGYLDYRAELSVDEARVIHERFRSAARQGVFNCDSWEALIRPMMEELDSALGPRSTEFSGFALCVSEWESGLGES